MGPGSGELKFQVRSGIWLSELNLNRIYLAVLATNERAINFSHHSLGFRDQGRSQQAQYKTASTLMF